MNEDKTFEEIMEDMKEKNPFRHDLILVLTEITKAREADRRATGVLIDMIGALSDRLDALEGGNTND